MDSAADIHLPDIPEYALDERMRQEREVTGLYLSGHPINAVRTEQPSEPLQRLGEAQHLDGPGIVLNSSVSHQTAVPRGSGAYDRFTVEEEGIRFGLVAIKNIGRGFIQGVVKERAANGNFTGFQDFCQRMYGADINKRAVENLIRAGAFDSFGAYRSQLIAVSDKLLDSIGGSRRQNVEGQLDFGSR
mgnify:CR=1 FL=1